MSASFPLSVAWQVINRPKTGVIHTFSRLAAVTSCHINFSISIKHIHEPFSQYEGSLWHTKYNALRTANLTAIHNQINLRFLHPFSHKKRDIHPREKWVPDQFFYHAYSPILNSIKLIDMFFLHVIDHKSCNHQQESREAGDEKPCGIR